MSGPYRIELLDADGCELSVTEENSFHAARRCAVEKTREDCYDDWRQARVLDSAGTCLWDKHRPDEGDRWASEQRATFAKVQP